MMAFSPEDLADLRRWALSGLAVVLAYAAIAAIVVRWHDPVEPAELAGAIVIEFAPVVAAPTAPPTDLPPGPEMVASDALLAKPVESVEDKPEERVEAKLESKVAPKVEERLETKPVEEPPLDIPPAPDPEVAVVPPPPEELKRETPRPQAAIAPAPVTTAPPAVPATPAAVPAGPTPSPSPRNSPGIVRWMAQISAALERNKRYPRQSEARREQGTAQVRFTLDRQGRVIESRLVQSSGAPALDDEALALLHRAQPFAPWPREEFAGERVELTVPIRFHLR
jgi:periplasmic protein TonB